MGKEILC